eukprot:COSAG02_NODE_3031_length_7513_cov_19.127192_3_plen_530_part_00
MGKKKLKPAAHRGSPAGTPTTALVAGGVGVLAAATAFFAGLRSISEPVGVSTVPVCVFGKDVHSVEQLFNRSTACLVQGLETEMHQEVIKQWSVNRLRQLPQGVMKLRVTEGDDHTRVMRYNKMGPRDTPTSSFRSKVLGLVWPREAYDMWEFKDATIENVINPDDDWSASFSTSSQVLRVPHPRGADAIDKLAEAVCPYGCPPEFSEQAGGRRESLIWIASRGLGQNLHFDSNANLFFHLHGSKQVVVSPPEEIIRHGHLLPVNHPAERQTQLLWTSEDPDRKLKGFNTAIGEDTDRPQPTYNQSREQVAYLQPGDVLYLPAFWGHQTFSGLGGPTVSLATWIFPAGGNPLGRLQAGEALEKKRGVRVREKLAEATNEASRLEPAATKKDSYAQWAALRWLAFQLAEELFEDGKEVMQEWHDQRWRPQFGGLGIDASAELPAAMCQEVRWSASTHVQHVAEAMREEASWYLEEHRELVLFQNLGNHLDWFAVHATSKILKSEFERKGSALKGRSAAQLGVVLASFVSC